MNEDIIIPIAGMIMIVSIALGLPLVRALVRRWERADAAPRVPREFAQLAQRLERIEQGVEAMAVEVDRISEGQRFTTKLLAERPDAVPVPRNGGQG